MLCATLHPMLRKASKEPVLTWPGHPLGEGPYIGLSSVFAALEAMPEARHLIAMSFGKRGWQKGGVMRAAKLSPRRRREIARTAVQARWGKRTKGGKRR